MNKDLLYYISSPYSHEDAIVREDRYLKVTELVEKMMLYGFLVYSPIAYGHPITVNNPKIGPGWERWQDLDTKMLNACDAMIVYKLDGWKESKGVLMEIFNYNLHGKDVWDTKPGKHQLYFGVVQ